LFFSTAIAKKEAKENCHVGSLGSLTVVPEPISAEFYNIGYHQQMKILIIIFGPKAKELT
jgi:hypothetical protein